MAQRDDLVMQLAAAGTSALSRILDARQAVILNETGGDL